MKTVVIGGTGLIGSKLVTKLSALGHVRVARRPRGRQGVRHPVGRRGVEVEPGALLAEGVGDLVGEQDHLELLQLRQAAHALVLNVLCPTPRPIAGAP